MIADPPLEAGAVNATVAVVCPVAVAVPMVGASGVVAGVTETEDEATESPAELTAFNVIVYAVPLVRPGIVIGLVASGDDSAV